MSLNLYNKILSIIEDNNFSSENSKLTTGGNIGEEVKENIVVADSSEKLEGGVAMVETMENLVGGNTNQNLTTNINKNIVVADSSEKLEGGANDNVGVSVGGKKHKKKPIKEIDEPPTEKKINENLFEGGCKNKYSDFLRRLNTTELFHDNSQEEQTGITGGNIIKGGESEDNIVEVLPMFPYLIRY